MRNRILLALGASVAMFLAGTVVRAAPSVDGEEAQKRVETLNAKVRWHRSLDEARALAAKEGKLVLWVHVLGALDGAT